MADANAALFGNGSGAPAWTWGDSPGVRASGEIVAMDAQQQRNMQTNELMFWPSGDKLMIAIVTIQTDLRDPSIPKDDGQRSIWVSGQYMTKAVKDAVRTAGEKQLELGGWISITFTGHGKAEKGFRAPRLFEAEYKAPTGNSAVNEALAMSDPSDAPAQTPPNKVNNSGGTSTAGTPSQAGSDSPGGQNAPSTVKAQPGIDLANLTPEALELLAKLQAGNKA